MGYQKGKTSINTNSPKKPLIWKLLDRFKDGKTLITIEHDGTTLLWMCLSNKILFCQVYI